MIKNDTIIYGIKTKKMFIAVCEKACSIRNLKWCINRSHAEIYDNISYKDEAVNLHIDNNIFLTHSSNTYKDRPEFNKCIKINAQNFIIDKSKLNNHELVSL